MRSAPLGAGNSPARARRNACARRNMVVQCPTVWPQRRAGAANFTQAMDMMPIKDSLHQLVEELPEEELSAALRFLQYLRDAGDAPPSPPKIMTVTDDDYMRANGDEETDGELSVADAWRRYLSDNPRF